MADNKVNSGLLEFSENQKVFVALDAETSEVQKAVTIDGDGVETDIQGVQPTGKKEITSTAEVNVASYATAQVVDEDLVAGNIKKDVDILGVVGSYEAPASDFSTAIAQCLFEASQTEPLLICMPSCISEVDNDTVDEYLFAGYIPQGAGEQEIIVPLYKGKAHCQLLTSSTTYWTVSGDAELSGNEIIITGNCTIAYSEK